MFEEKLTDRGVQLPSEELLAEMVPVWGRGKLTEQQGKCVRGEHERMEMPPISGVNVYTCKHCRCLYVER